MEGERRIVTMLFCDVKGSTAMAENLDPEEWAEIMNGAFEYLIAPVYRYEGTVARLMGDAIFALFGAPIAHEDDPQRAVWAGLEIIDGITAYRGKVRADRGLDLNVRVGINTGQVMVGQVGSALKLEYTAMGDAVNVAARMEQTAEPGTVQITSDTHRLVAPLFDVESRGGIEVKGKAKPVAAYVVLGSKANAGPARGFRIGGREPPPLVGREREMAILRHAMAEVIDGRGQMVSLIGDAGLGKSRLIEEALKDWAANRPDQPSDTWDEHGARRALPIGAFVQASAYDATRPYAQYRRVLARNAGITDTDSGDVVRQKLARTTELDPEEWRAPRLRMWRSLFGVPEPGEEALEGEAFKRAATGLAHGTTHALGSDPRVLVFEDLHWCDEASMDLLMETARAVDDLPFLFLFAFRPDPQASSWRLKQWLEIEYAERSTEILLSPLSEEESGALIDELLPEQERSAGLRTQILERTEGNPLYLEEVVSALSEDGSQRGNEIAIPTTLQALITARLDRLDDDARRTLQLASVIGRSFDQPVLRAISGEGVELERQLATLERVGLLDQTARVPEPEYSFHHSLTQDATYSTILLSRRRQLHLQVGKVMQEIYAKRIEEFAPLLAQHFQAAGDDHRTLKYATMAGDSAVRMYANAEAVTHYTSAIDAARRIGDRDALLSDLYRSRGRALEISERHEEAVANYEEMLAVAQLAGDQAAALDARAALAGLSSRQASKVDP